MEATLHMDVLSLFHSIWSNKETAAFSILQYILKMGDTNSLTWSIHVRNLFLLYNLPDPLTLLSEAPWSKERWKAHYTIKIRSHHEKLLRESASTNSKMEWFNISLIGLTGRHHPILHNITTTRQAEQARPQIKMLCGDYLTMDRLVQDRQSGDPSCQLCPSPTSPPPETLPHLLTECRGTADLRERIFPQLLTTLNKLYPSHPLLQSPLSHHRLDYTLTQFLIDPTSFNLPQCYRLGGPYTSEVFDITRSLCSAMDR